MATTPVKLALIGASGRMGKQLSTLIEADAGWHVVTEISSRAAVDRASLQAADVAVDFSSPEALTALLPLFVEHQIPLVTGTTGLEDKQQQKIIEAAKTLPILQAGNMSLGVAVLEELVAQVARQLDSDFDIEIVEAHHANKKDAPSGTALMLGAAARRGRGGDVKEIFNRHGMVGERPKGAIGYEAIRAGGIIGDHDVKFASGEEILTLSHRALDRALFARGALKAAHWLIQQTPGLYRMRDCLD